MDKLKIIPIKGAVVVDIKHPDYKKWLAVKEIKKLFYKLTCGEDEFRSDEAFRKYSSAILSFNYHIKNLKVDVETVDK